MIFFTSSALVSKSNWKSSEIFEIMMMNKMEMVLSNNDIDGHDDDIVFSADHYLPYKGMKQVLSFRSPSPVVELTSPGVVDAMI